MIVIGITGGVGTGKSTVAQMFKALGAVVLDADAIARQVVEPQRLAWRRIVKAFGEGVLNEDRSVNRARLAALVFADPARRGTLEAIIHPQVLRRIKQDVHRLRGRRRVKAVVLDVPLLMEANAQDVAETVVVVTAPPEAQRRRLRQQHGWSDQEIAARQAAQLELSAKVALADHVIDNGGSVDATRTQVKRLWNQLVAR